MRIQNAKKTPIHQDGQSHLLLFGMVQGASCTLEIQRAALTLVDTGFNVGELSHISREWIHHLLLHLGQDVLIQMVNGLYQWYWDEGGDKVGGD